METFGERFARVRKEADISQRELGRRVGYSGSAISQWESGETAPELIRRAALETAAGILGRSVRYLLTGRDDSVGETDRPEYIPAGASSAPPDVRNVPLISLVAAGFDGDCEDPYPRGEGAERVAVDAELGRGLSRLTFALEISGNSMADEFQDGDIVIIDPAVAPMPGDFVVAKIDGETKATFKKYRARGTDSDGSPVFELVPLNEDYATVTVSSTNPGRIIGTMVEHRRRRRRRS